MSREIHEKNRQSWNTATRAHNSHKADQAKFLREGGSTLFSDEIELLGPLQGKRLLHLLCNSGQDSLSLARLGAQVTGVDISDEAISFATRLSDESGLAATFERADVFDWLAEAAGQAREFDIVYSSYGALPWLSSLDSWASGAADLLRPGGRLVLIEFHPFLMMFDEEWQQRYPYSTRGREVREAAGVGDYVADSNDGLTPSGHLPGDDTFKNSNPSFEYYWGVGDVIGAVVGAGLVLEHFREYSHSNGYSLSSKMRSMPDRRYRTPEGTPDMPLMYGLSARRP